MHRRLTSYGRGRKHRRQQDLVLAIDEAASILISCSGTSTTLSCTVNAAPEEPLRAVLTVTNSVPIDESAFSFGWFVMRSLVDDVLLVQFPFSGGNRWTVSIVLIAVVADPHYRTQQTMAL